MSKQVVLLFLAICSYPGLSFAQTTCCDNPICRDSARQVVTSLGKTIDFLGVYPSGQPVDDERKKQFIDSLKNNEPARYNTIRQAAHQFDEWGSINVSRRDCLTSQFENLSPDQRKWVSYFITALFSSGFRSPEFRKGFGILVHTGIGASSLFTSSERFASLSGLLLSYTFTPKGQNTGGYVRAMIGPGLYYSATKTYLLVHPRFEFRIKDLGSDLASIGCVKLIAQGGFQKHIQLVGLGIGAEISRFHLQLTENYLFNESALVLQFGLGYSFAFNKQ